MGWAQLHRMVVVENPVLQILVTQLCSGLSSDYHRMATGGGLLAKGGGLLAMGGGLLATGGGLMAHESLDGRSHGMTGAGGQPCDTQASHIKADFQHPHIFHSLSICDPS